MAGQTTVLLVRWHDGDQEAFNELIERHLERLREMVRRRLGSHLRKKIDSGDVVQQAMFEFLRYGPKFKPTNGAQFRGLLATIITNVINDSSQWYSAKRRAMAREIHDGETVLDLSVQNTFKDPSSQAESNENMELLRLALEFVDPLDRRAFVMRELDHLSYREIGSELGTSEDAARMKIRRAKVRIASVIEDLKSGNPQRLEKLFDNRSEADARDQQDVGDDRNDSEAEEAD